jgi:hypothetical protein
MAGAAAIDATQTSKIQSRQARAKRLVLDELGVDVADTGSSDGAGTRVGEQPRAKRRSAGAPARRGLGDVETAIGWLCLLLSTVLAVCAIALSWLAEAGYDVPFTCPYIPGSRRA